jgi:hypothetical protein
MASEPITNFAGANGSTFTVDGYSAQAENANQAWSLTQPDANTLQFSVRSGDTWRTSGYTDSGANRSEIQFGQQYSAGTQMNLSETITVQPGPTNTASWLDLTQLHATTNVAPTYSPFVLGVDKSDHLVVILQHPNQSANTLVYRSPDPIVRGQPMDFDFQVIMGPTGGGYVGVWKDGTQIVNYHGPVGATNSEYYWKIGVYRGSAPETFTATFSNVDISTGAAAAPTTPTQPTTPTSPTTPPNLAPSVTQVSATPGTGIADNGDTITMTLRFSETVAVTGTPTLSLNNGSTATYVGGSGTDSLTFKTTVAPTDKDTSALGITGVNLANGASIKDTSGLAASLSGAVKTFTGLQVDATPTSPTTPTTPTSPTNPTTPTAPTSSVTKPVLTIADNTLSVTGRGGRVDLGTKVTTTDTNDRVTVKVTGLSRYETITTSDGRTFRGDNITLTAAQVNGGLELRSYYYRGGAPESTLTLTASAKDPVTGAVTSAAPQTITVTDPRRGATTATTTQQTNTVTNPPSSTSTSIAAATAPQPTVAPDATAASAGFLANQGFAMLRGNMDSAISALATTTRSQAIATDPHPAAGATTASLASQSFALLNQHLAGSVGRLDQGQLVSAVSQPTAFGREGILARPQS